MKDRIQALIAVPVDVALPIDVQAVGLRRKAIDLMSEIAVIEESTVRYLGAADDATLFFEGDIGLLSLWQHNLIGARFIADGKAKEGVVGPFTRHDPVTRTFESTSVERNPYD
ncbi:hypothetical protein A5630_25265 [Mycolicibacterium mucogenicum]|uniref:Uncharacterized protein n=1 Tax=Mycolicibacterium mucogenicum TaxID=56689 RepID=A0A1A3GY09_MYCMU|nr:protein GP44 [Mycolicibacterium mucogenicum]OBJ40263.1 hypothetical protein A5630_25265 [Mycolicibacterium mucogenicum]